MTGKTMGTLQWRKSSHSGGNGECVEFAVPDVVVAVRDSKDPEGPQLRFSTEAWTAFVNEVTAGGFDTV